MHLIPALIKSFTQDPAQGNPTAVYIIEEDLPDIEYFNLAQSTGFSECVFVNTIENIPFLRFFSPATEMSMCGHAALAAAYVLQAKLHPSILKTKSGIINISYHPDGLIEMEITAKPYYYDNCITADRIAELLNIEHTKIISEPLKVSVGTPKVLVELDSIATLWNMLPNFSAIAQEIPQGIYPYVKINKNNYYARQFNPATGVNEDPVTGIAAAALGMHLRDAFGLNDQFTVEQGHMLNKKGTIFVDVREGIKIGGYAVECMSVDITAQS